MPQERPNVLFVQSDEHSVRCFGHRDRDVGEPVETPTLDGVATGGVEFQQTYCPMPLCGPSRICTLTGREVCRSGGWDNVSVVPPGLPTLPGTLSAAGYETCHLGKLHAAGSRRFLGFDHRPYGIDGGHQPDPPDPGGETGLHDRRSRTAEAGVTGIPESLHQERAVVDEAVAWLREHRHRRDRPWFLNASFSRPHFPLTAPRRHFERYWPEGVTAPKVGREGDTADHPVTERQVAEMGFDAIGQRETRRARAAYFACVSYLDEILGDLLATLEREGFLEDTVVIYASDHGELAGEHGLWWKSSWHEASTRTPWLVQTPAHRDGESGATVETPVSLLDLFPTVCGLADVDAPAGLDGHDLSETVHTGAEPDRGPVFCDYLDPRFGEGSEYRLVRDGRYKYVEYRGEYPPLLFDLEADPTERQNLADDPEYADTRRRLHGLVADTMDFDAAEAERERDERMAEQFELAIPREVGNSYLLPDGQLVAADTPLYKPHVLTANPGAAFDDYPGDSE